MTKDGAKKWSKVETRVQPGRGEGWVAVALAQNALNGILVSTRGSVFVTNDGGESWVEREPLGLRRGEAVHRTEAVSFSADAMHGLIVGNARSVLVTVDGGNSWRTTERFDTDYAFGAVASVPPQRSGQTYTAVALDQGGNLYFLEPHTFISNWREWSPQEVVRSLRNSSALRESLLVQEIETFMSGQSSVSSSATSADSVGSGRQEVGVLAGIFQSVNFLRVFTLAILFFLVALFVRLYQYNLRLAAFWESRSDAVLLANRLMHCDSRSFGELVRALSPDKYDFKSAPRSSLSESAADLLWRRRSS